MYFSASAPLMPTAIKLNSRFLRMSTADLSFSIKLSGQVTPSVMVRTIFGTPFSFGRMTFSRVSMLMGKVSASGVFVVLLRWRTEVLIGYLLIAKWARGSLTVHVGNVVDSFDNLLETCSVQEGYFNPGLNTVVDDRHPGFILSDFKRPDYRLSKVPHTVEVRLVRIDDRIGRVDLHYEIQVGVALWPSSGSCPMSTLRTKAGLLILSIVKTV